MRWLGVFVLTVGWASLVGICIVAGQSQSSAQAYMICFPIAAAVLMDLNMPGQDGLSVTRSLREQDPDLWVVALTANVQEADRRRCREAGMRDFVPKPYDLAALAGAMTRWGSRA